MEQTIDPFLKCALPAGENERDKKEIIELECSRPEFKDRLASIDFEIFRTPATKPETKIKIGISNPNRQKITKDQINDFEKGELSKKLINIIERNLPADRETINPKLDFETLGESVSKIRATVPIFPCKAPETPPCIVQIT